MDTDSQNLLSLQETRTVASSIRMASAGRKNVRHAALTIFASLFILFAIPLTALSIPLDAYHQRVVAAALALDSLSLQDEALTEQQEFTREQAVMRNLRESIILKNETVEWNGARVEVDNAWLGEALVNYEQLNPSDWQRRAALRKEMAERLLALVDRLAEAMHQNPSGASKEEEKARLAAVLRRSEYDKKASEGSALGRILRRILRWIFDLFPSSSPLRPGQVPFISRLAEIFVIALAIAITLYFSWRFLPRFISARGQRKAKKSETARVVLGERLRADQTAADLLAEAEALARAGDLRAAIRKGYIALLCELGDRKVISLAQHKTNRDYLRALRDRTAIFQPVQQLTYSFENHWYGNAPAAPEDWQSFRASYQEVASQRVTSDE